MLRFVLVSMLFLANCVVPAAARESVTLQLKWTHAFQFAGYYAAQELGYYRDAGLDVRIVPGSAAVNPFEVVLGGAAEYGVGNSSLLLERRAGKPLVALAVIFQHSPSVLLVARHAMPHGARDLIGKRIMIEPQSDELLAYLRRQGVTADRFTPLPHEQSVQPLIEGKVDAMTSYVTVEPYLLEQAGFAFRALKPISAGIDFYGDNLFTTEREIRQHPARAQAFRDASLRGWQYAMAHPEQVIELMMAHYPLPRSRDFYLHEAAAMAPLLRTDLVEVGYMNPTRWRQIADTYADLGLLPRAFPLDGLLYRPSPRPDRRWLYGVTALLLLTSAATLYIHRVNLRLARALRASTEAELAMRHMAQHDGLTGLPNRTLFADRLEQALAGARRDRLRLAVLFIDLDGFKAVNDDLGHDAGDLLLKDVAQRLLRSVRASDSVARIGGDEFIVLLRSVDSAAAALAIGDKLCAALRRPFPLDGRPANVSASIGVALYPEHGDDAARLTRCADSAMYEAKKAGNTRSVLFVPPTPT
jgi:diguanylate cyclase (GGDEF)-like protein